MFDYLIVGAGLSGCVLAERIASQLDRDVLLIDKRNHIGGNAFDYYNENGILVHKYGPHIFHTNSLPVVNYLSQFTKWRPYFHHVLGLINDSKIPIPFNLNSIYTIFADSYAEKIENALIANYGYGNKISILNLKQTKSQLLKELADFVYKNVFYNYTVKQWELEPEELDPSVMERVPVFISKDDRYFQDKYQLMPEEGFSRMFEKMLLHKKIKIALQTDYRDISELKIFKNVIFTGPIDEYFDYSFGELPYRSLKFEHVMYELNSYQEVGTINYPNNYDYTRVTEHKHITGQIHKATIISKEYPQKYTKEENIPYYPIPTRKNNNMYQYYEEQSRKIKHIYFLGRLANYRYYNMDQIIENALKLFKDLSGQL